MNKKLLVAVLFLGVILFGCNKVSQIKEIDKSILVTNEVKAVDSEEVMVITDYAYDYSSEDFCGLIGKVVKVTYRSVYGIQQVTGRIGGLYDNYFSLRVNNGFGELYDYKDIGDLEAIQK